MTTDNNSDNSIKEFIESQRIQKQIENVFENRAPLLTEIRDHKDIRDKNDIINRIFIRIIKCDDVIIEEWIKDISKASKIKKSVLEKQFKQLKREHTTLAKEKHKEEIHAPLSIKEAKKTFQKWLYIKDPSVLDIIFSVAVAEKVKGDPLWLFIIAPPGGTKSEILRSFQDGKMFYHLSSLTANTFVSGYYHSRDDKVKDLLPQLNRKVLIFKDFTLVLTMHREMRTEIIGQLRDIYDGKFSKKFGTSDEKISYNSRFGLIAGVTPVIDRHWRVMQELGERFLKLRMITDINPVTDRAELMEGEEERIREELKYATMGLMTNIKPYKVKLLPKHRAAIKELAKFIAIMRTPVYVRFEGDELVADLKPEPEIPTRVVKQLKKLLRCLCIVRGKKESSDSEIELVGRVARDTVPQDRLLVVRYLFNHSEVEEKQLIDDLRIARSTLRILLQQLWRLDIVDKNYDKIGDNKLYLYSLTEKFKKQYNLSRLIVTREDDTESRERVAIDAEFSEADKAELIHHQCSICGLSPCVSFDVQGKPLCYGCNKAYKKQSVSRHA